MGMKQFHGHIIHFGYSFDIRFCAKSYKEAVDILNKNIHDNYTLSYVRNYFSGVPINEPYENILVTPYGHQTWLLFPDRSEIKWEEAKKIIDATKVKK